MHSGVLTALPVLSPARALPTPGARLQRLPLVLPAHCKVWRYFRFSPGVMCITLSRVVCFLVARTFSLCPSRFRRSALTLARGAASVMLSQGARYTPPCCTLTVLPTVRRSTLPAPCKASPVCSRVASCVALPWRVDVRACITPPVRSPVWVLRSRALQGVGAATVPGFGVLQGARALPLLHFRRKVPSPCALSGAAGLLPALSPWCALLRALDVLPALPGSPVLAGRCKARAVFMVLSLSRGALLYCSDVMCVTLPRHGSRAPCVRKVLQGARILPLHSRRSGVARVRVYPMRSHALQGAGCYYTLPATARG